MLRYCREIFLSLSRWLTNTQRVVDAFAPRNGIEGTPMVIEFVQNQDEAHVPWHRNVNAAGRMHAT